MNKTKIWKKQAGILVATLLMSTIFTTTVYAQCPCHQYMLSEESVSVEIQESINVEKQEWDIENPIWDQDGDGNIDPGEKCDGTNLGGEMLVAFPASLSILDFNSSAITALSKASSSFFALLGA